MKGSNNFILRDPYVPKFLKKRDYSFDRIPINLSSEVLRQVDCAVIATDHDDVDYAMVHEHASLQFVDQNFNKLQRKKFISY